MTDEKAALYEVQNKTILSLRSVSKQVLVLILNISPPFSEQHQKKGPQVTARFSDLPILSKRLHFCSIENTTDSSHDLTFTKW